MQVTKNSKAVIASLLLVSLTVIPAIGNAISISGYASCGEWVERRSQHAASWYEFWLLGYLSGIASGTGVDILKDTEEKSLFLWMDNYCNKHPLSRIDFGAGDLVSELAKKRQHSGN